MTLVGEMAELRLVVLGRVRCDAGGKADEVNGNDKVGRTKPEPPPTPGETTPPRMSKGVTV